MKKYLDKWNEHKEHIEPFMLLIAIAVFPSLYKVLPFPYSTFAMIPWWICLWRMADYVSKGALFKWMMRAAEEKFQEQKKKQNEYSEAMNELIKK